jgi:signal recognition particle receptor subunit beta
LDRVFKVLVTGPFDSGKTTFIGTISEIEVVSTERNTRDGDGQAATTTVAMDFGRITFPDGYILHMYGTPGQERFDFMWEILSEGMLGYVVLLDGSKPSSFDEGRKIIEIFEAMADVPYVIGLTRADRRDCVDPNLVEKDIVPLDSVDIIRCDARNRQDVKTVLITLLERVLEKADGRPPANKKHNRSLTAWPEPR